MPTEDTDPGEGLVHVGLPRLGAGLGVLALCFLMPALPVLVAWGLAAGPAARVAATVAAGTAAVLGGGKVAAVAWGLVVRWEAPPSP